MKGGTAFTLKGDIITENKTGNTGRIVKEGESYKVTLIKYVGAELKRQALASRMSSWYYYTQVNAQQFKDNQK